MPLLYDRVPKYRFHKPSGQAIVTLNSVDHYLGPYGTQVSKDEYDRHVAHWLARGRRPESFEPQNSQVLVNEVILAFWEHAQVYYRRADGSPTSEIENFRQALRPLRQLYGTTEATSFGPKALKAVREQMISKGWSRRNINKQIDRLRHVFRWASSEEILSASIYEQLRTVPPLKRGRTTARETLPVKPAPDEQIQAIKPFVSRQVWAMVQLQLLTGARPGEIVGLRGIDFSTRDQIWTVEPAEHKTAYRGLAKTIYFGPLAQKILNEFLCDRPIDAYLFCPEEAETDRRARVHEARQTPRSCGNSPGTNRKPECPQVFNEHYTVDSFRQAIERGCDLAFPPPDALARQRIAAARGTRNEKISEWKSRLGADKWAALLAWQKAHRWHPHQLRHNAAT